jgi:hypothetical protein
MKKTYLLDIGSWEKGITLKIKATSSKKAKKIAYKNYSELFCEGSEIVQIYLLRNKKKICVFDFMNGDY